MFDLSQITSAVAAVLFGMLVSAGLAGAETVTSPPAAAEADDVWAGLVTDVFDDRPMKDGKGIISMQAPSRAEDAAVVPIVLEAGLPAGDTRFIRRITLVIDNNPAPVAAAFELGEKAGVSRIETRVRVDRYTKVHAVAEASDGTLYMTEAFVKASGGCSAPAMKDAVAALAEVGRMKMKQFPPKIEGASQSREAQVMIRHPQYSGLQMDQVTRHYVPAWFISDLTVSQGDDLIFRVAGGISLSEDPNIRFSFVPHGTDDLVVEAVDTEQKRYEGRFPFSDES